MPLQEELEFTLQIIHAVITINSGDVLDSDPGVNFIALVLIVQKESL